MKHQKQAGSSKPHSAKDRGNLTLPRYTLSTAGVEMVLPLIPRMSGPGRWTSLDRTEKALAAVS